MYFDRKEHDDVLVTHFGHLLPGTKDVEQDAAAALFLCG